MLQFFFFSIVNLLYSFTNYNNLYIAVERGDISHTGTDITHASLNDESTNANNSEYITFYLIKPMLKQ